VEQTNQTPNQLDEEKTKEVVKNCDAVLFCTYEVNGFVETSMNFMKCLNEEEPTPFETGYKYKIVLFKTSAPLENEVEIFSAIIGDPHGYCYRMGKGCGYTGMLLKMNAWKGTGLKEMTVMLEKFFTIYRFDELLKNKIVAQMVE
jgi:hypothetical protein